MSDIFNLEVSDNDARYHIERTHGCIIIRGSIPIVDLVALTNAAPDGAVMSTDLCRMANATMVYGLPADLQKLRETLAPAALKAARTMVKDSGLALDEACIEWLALGERGLSADTIFSRVTGLELMASRNREDSVPSDPSDLRRCMLLLESCQTVASGFTQTLKSHPQWQALVARWSELVAVFEQESPEWRDPNAKWSAPRTHALIKAITKRK